MKISYQYNYTFKKYKKFNDNLYINYFFILILIYYFYLDKILYIFT